MISQITDYPKFLSEIARILRPGGIVLLIETETEPMLDGIYACTATVSYSHKMPNWTALWNEYNGGLRYNGVDFTTPRLLYKLVRQTRSFRDVFYRHYDVPVGSWTGQGTSLTYNTLHDVNQAHIDDMSHAIGQLARESYGNFANTFQCFVS